MKKILLVIFLMLFTISGFALTTTLKPLTVTPNTYVEFSITVKTATTIKDKILTVSVPPAYSQPSINTKDNGVISYTTKGKITSVSIENNKIKFYIKSLTSGVLIKIKYGNKKTGKGVYVAQGTMEQNIFETEIDGVKNTIEVK